MTRGRVQYIGLVTAATGRRQDGVLRDIVCAAAAEHEGVHTHSHMASFRLDTLPNKHACAVQTVHRTRLWADFVACNIKNTTDFRITCLSRRTMQTHIPQKCVIFKCVSTSISALQSVSPEERAAIMNDVFVSVPNFCTNC